MKNKLKSVTNGSRRATTAQPKTRRAPSRLHTREVVTYCGPAIALFPQETGGGDDGIAEEVIDLSNAELTTLKRAAAAAGSTVLMFIANTALQAARAIPEQGLCSPAPVPGRQPAEVPMEPPNSLWLRDFIAKNLRLSPEDYEQLSWDVMNRARLLHAYAAHAAQPESRMKWRSA